MGYITTESDPTVPAWAKAQNKPTYTASEVGAISTSHVINNITSTDISNWNAKLDSYTETDPTVPAWAKASSAPVSSVNGDTGAVVVDQLKTTGSSNNTEYNLIGTATSNANTAAVDIYKQDLLSFAKTTSLGRLTIGSTSMPGVVRIYTSVDSASGFTDIQSNASSTNERIITLPDASGTVALTSDLNSYVKEHVHDSSTSGIIHNSLGNVYLSTTTSRTNSSKIDLNGSTIKIKSWSGVSESSTSVIEITPTTTTIKNVVTPTENGDAVNKEYVDGLVSGMLHYKGTKATVSALPSSGNTTGDVWHITADGSEWAWDGSEWQELGTTIDLSGYVPSSRTINGKALTANISLSASDVSALPASTTYVSSFNGQSGAITYTPPVTSVNEQTGAVTITASSISAASATHAHGNITSGGDMTATTAIASGDRLVINDESASKLASSTITFGSSTAQYLANNGTWQNAYDDTALAARVTALEQIPWVTYYTGSTTPSNSQGNNGDLYFQTSQ